MFDGSNHNFSPDEIIRVVVLGKCAAGIFEQAI